MDAALRAAGLPPPDDDFERDIAEAVALVTNAGSEPIRRRQFVSREDFAARSRTAPSTEIEAFRADEGAAIDGEIDDPYDR